MNNTADGSQLELLHAEGNVLELRFKGPYTFETRSPTEFEHIISAAGTMRGIRIFDDGIAEWDSSLLTLALKLKTYCAQHSIELDIDGLPRGVQRLVGLATAVPERKGARRDGKRDSLLIRIGKWALDARGEALAMFSFLGEASTSALRMVTGRARYRRSELWLIIQQCGPQALGIVTTISVLVGTILAFVGAIQLKMFGAEIYVANLVGLGMVIEMGALMTGIILAGRTGAAFAAQLGTMQVNEEIDALKTMGIPPMDYLVLPRMTALALMTPLLVIYADVLGILGGLLVGVFFLDIPLLVFINQTFELMTGWHCAQGLIKGSTFGILIALAGCLRGMQCGRSASAVGDAATSAVVTGIVMIVVADAMWTFIFMMTG